VGLGPSGRKWSIEPRKFPRRQIVTHVWLPLRSASVDELSEFLDEARNGSEDAFAAFVSRSQAEIWRLCSYLVGTAEADDATQETYLAAWRGMAAFRGDSSARTWLFVIARRTSLGLAKRKRGLVALEQRVPRPVEAADAETWTDLSVLVDRLDQDRREALILTQLFGLSYAETAQVCGCAVGTIRSRVARARQDLLASWTGTRPVQSQPSVGDVVQETVAGNEGR
jgi:RNA polymerase sigma-70 factor (ECF subfamily)